VLANGVSVGSSPLLPTAAAWTQQSLTFTAAAGTLQLDFQPVSGNKSYISIDGIALADAIPEPASVVLIAGGLAAMALIGRRRSLARRS
jgi:hypothetical protein